MRVAPTVLVAAAIAAIGLLASSAWAVPCDVAIRLSAPKKVVAGKKFTATASIRNTGSTAIVDGLYFQLELPDYLVPRGGRASAFATKGASDADAVLDPRFVRFGSLRLPARKTLRLKMAIGVPTCQAAGPIALQGMAYRLDGDDNVACSTSATIMTTVARKIAVANSKHAVQGNCTEPGPGTEGMALVGTNERCMQSQPLPEDQVRRFRSLLKAQAQVGAGNEAGAHRMLAASQSAAQACFACCAEFLGVAPPYYFNVRDDGRCYCCEDCDPVYVPGWTVSANGRRRSKGELVINTVDRTVSPLFHRTISAWRSRCGHGPHQAMVSSLLLPEVRTARRCWPTSGTASRGRSTTGPTGRTCPS